MSPPLALWMGMACAQVSAEGSVADFCGLVESLGPEFASGDTIILECAGGAFVHACAEAGEGFLWTDEGSVAEATRRCDESGGTYVDGDYTACEDTAGELISMQSLQCQRNPGIL